MRSERLIIANIICSRVRQVIIIALDLKCPIFTWNIISNIHTHGRSKPKAMNSRNGPANCSGDNNFWMTIRVGRCPHPLSDFDFRYERIWLIDGTRTVQRLGRHIATGRRWNTGCRRTIGNSIYNSNISILFLVTFVLDVKHLLASVFSWGCSRCFSARKVWWWRLNKIA